MCRSGAAATVALLAAALAPALPPAHSAAGRAAPAPRVAPLRSRAPEGRAVGPSDPLWGVDSASYVYDVLAATEKDYGTPQVFARYITSTDPTRCEGHGLTPAEVGDLFAAGIAVMLIDATAQCDDGTSTTGWSGAAGTRAADAAIAAARAIGVPAGVAIYEDIEFDAQVTPAFLEAYDAALAASPYLPGFYAQTSNASNPWFIDSYCTAVADDPQLGDALYWASAPALSSGRSGPKSEPRWDPNPFSCTPPLQTVAWQYGRPGNGKAPPVPVDVDTDEFAGTEGLWEPPADGSFVESGGQIYRIAGGAPIPLTSWAAIGGEPKGTTVAPMSALLLADLSPYPAEGTVLISGTSGNRFVVQDGAPILTPGASGPAVTVDPAALDHAGQGGIWAHLARPDGYWLVSAGGTVQGAGQAVVRGSFAAAAGDPVVGAAASADGGGYWLVTKDGGVAAFGDARSFGDLPAEHVDADDVVAIAPTADGGGYWLIGADGGIFCFGDARYHGSLPALGEHVDDVVGMVASASAAGYLVVGADGGVFAFGAVHYLGSLPALGVHVDTIRALLPAPGDTGYILVGSDGGAFVFGRGAPYHGSLPGDGDVVDDVVGIALTGDGGGYWMATATGTVYRFGDAAALQTGAAPALPVSTIVGA